MVDLASAINVTLDDCSGVLACSGRRAVGLAGAGAAGWAGPAAVDAKPSCLIRRSNFGPAAWRCAGLRVCGSGVWRLAVVAKTAKGPAGTSGVATGSAQCCECTPVGSSVVALLLLAVRGASLQQRGSRLRRGRACVRACVRASSCRVLVQPVCVRRCGGAEAGAGARWNALCVAAGSRARSGARLRRSDREAQGSS